MRQSQVVIVEDDTSVRQATERLLRAAGYTTVAFASAEALIEAGVADHAACLVLDVRLPGLSGLELRARLEDSGIKPPAIFITAHDDPRVREQANLAGALAYLLKPCAGALLLAAVARAFER